MKAYKHLVRYALADGANISVFDGEEWQENRSTNAAAIIAAIESVEEAELIIKNNERRIAWARVAAYGLADDETVVDYTVNDFMNAWETAYNLATA
jgi:hypothetical protein